MSKCALRDKRNGTLGCPNAPRLKFIVLVRIKSPPHRQGSWMQRSERPFPVSLPPGSAVVSSLFAPYYGHASRLPPVGASPVTISFRFRSYKNPFCQSWRGRKKAACEIFSHKPPLASFVMLFSFPVLRRDGFPAIPARPLLPALLRCILSASCG